MRNWFIDLAQNTKLDNNTTTQTEGPIVVAKDIKKTAKLLYTVQIGVYKKAVPLSRLYNLSPISYVSSECLKLNLIEQLRRTESNSESEKLVLEMEKVFIIDKKRINFLS